MPTGHSHQSTSSQAEPPVNPSLSPESAAPSMMAGAISALLSAKSQTNSIPNGFSGKMYPASLIQWTTRSDACWENYVEQVTPSSQRQEGNTLLAAWWPDRSAPWLGGPWTPNGSECPSVGDASLSWLEEVLETGPAPTHYYLSERACRGILRRAEKRGKKLPPELERALKDRIGTEEAIPPLTPGKAESE